MKEIIKRILENSYLFYHSRNTKPDKKIKLLKNKIEQLQLKFVENSYNDSFSFVIRKSKNEKFIFENKLNEQYDYNMSNIWANVEKINFGFPLPDYDTLLSYSLLKNNIFFAVNDYNAIIKHYYYKDDNIFICSNNSFLVAYLCGSNISDAAVYETLFFRFPYKTGSFFKNVKSLKPFQVLKFNLRTNSFSLSNSISQSDLINKYGFKTLPEAADDFFSRLKFNYPVSLSFSGGSDSTTIAALLEKYNIPFSLLSFEGHNAFDTKRIIRFARKAKKTFILLNAKEQNTTDESIFEYTVLSNGNIVSSHFYNFYKSVNKSIIFDGYSFVAGDYSDATISNIHGEILKNKSIDIIYKYFKGIKSDFLLNMNDYIKNNYTFINCNSNEGLTYIQNYSFDFVNGTVNAGAILPSIYFGHDNYSFFLSKKFMLTILKNGYGIAKSFSKRNDYPGYVKSKQALAILGNYCNNIFYKIVMDNGLSLKDIHINSEIYNKALMYLNRRKKSILFHTFYRKYPKVDNFNFKPYYEELLDFSIKFVSEYTVLNKKSIEAIKTLYMVDKSFKMFCSYFFK